VTTPDPSACVPDGVGVSMSLVAWKDAGYRPGRHVVSH
jgi:hypothetical protein